MVNLRRLFLQTIICRFFIVWMVVCFSYGVFSAGVINVGVGDGKEATFEDVLEGNSGINKTLGGILVMPNGKSSTGPTNVLGGTLISHGPLAGPLAVQPGATYISSSTAENIENTGNLQTGDLTSPSPSFLTLANFVQTSAINSILSVKIFPNGTCDYLQVNTATLTGKLNVYVQPGDYDEGGVIFPVVRGGTVNGAFLSLVNATSANVSLSYKENASAFDLIVKGNVPYVPPTKTVYEVGLRLNHNQRHDSIKIGSSGGFEGFSIPEDWCRAIYINFVQTETPPEQNTILTNSYSGSGDIPYLPDYIKEIWFTGDSTGYDELVRGGTQYALPTPGVNTRIRFALSKSPASSPLAWFQGRLPAGCQLVVEPGSADPFIHTVLPLEGGQIIIGAPVTLQPGFSTLFSHSQPCTIQRHPAVAITDVSQALITLTEPTTFQWGIYGLSLSGAYPATFIRTSSLVEPHTDSANAGYNVAENSTLTIYRFPNTTFPEVGFYLAGSTSHITSSSDLAKADREQPHISPPLNERNEKR